MYRMRIYFGPYCAEGPKRDQGHGMVQFYQLEGLDDGH